MTHQTQLAELEQAWTALDAVPDDQHSPIMSVLDRQTRSLVRDVVEGDASQDDKRRAAALFLRDGIQDDEGGELSQMSDRCAALLARSAN